MHFKRQFTVWLYTFYLHDNKGEKFGDTKKRLEKRTGIKGKSFEKIKFAIARRANYSKPQYLNDGSSTLTSDDMDSLKLTTAYNADDELWNIASSEDDYLGFDHPDRTRSLRNGVGDLFLR